MNCTPATPTLSVAFAVTETVPDTMPPAAGAVIDTVGAVLSLETVTPTADDVVRVPAMLRATAVNV